MEKAAEHAFHFPVGRQAPAIDRPAGETVPPAPPRRFGHLVRRGAAGEARRHDASRADTGQSVNRDLVLTQDLQNAHVRDAAREPAAQRESDPGRPRRLPNVATAVAAIRSRVSELPQAAYSGAECVAYFVVPV